MLESALTTFHRALGDMRRAPAHRTLPRVTRFQVLYWQDVPSLVRVHADGGGTSSHPLPDWFQQEIDRRAMAQGLVGSDAYLEQWRWGEVDERPEPVDAIVEELAASFGRSGDAEE